MLAVIEETLVFEGFAAFLERNLRNRRLSVGRSPSERLCAAALKDTALAGAYFRFRGGRLLFRLADVGEKKVHGLRCRRSGLENEAGVATQRFDLIGEVAGAVVDVLAGRQPEFGEQERRSQFSDEFAEGVGVLFFRSVEPDA